MDLKITDNLWKKITIISILIILTLILIYLNSQVEVPNEPCLFVHYNNMQTIDFVVMLYVDDILFCGINYFFENVFLAALAKRFNIKSTYDVTKFLGINMKISPNYSIRLTL